MICLSFLALAGAPGSAVSFATTAAERTGQRTSGEKPAIAGRRGHPLIGKLPRKRAAVRFHCDEALDDGSLVDFSQADHLARLARALTWPEIGPPSAVPPRDVRIVCGPDVDGDGARDALARISFDDPEATASELDAGLTVYTLLVSKQGGTDWHALAPLAAEITGDRDVEQSLAFVRVGPGKWGIELERSSFASETGCRITAYELFAWREGQLRTIEAGDRSPICAPCGCDRP